MRTKDITPGIPYLKKKTRQWGVPVTTDRLYEIPHYAKFTQNYLHEGRGVLVIVVGRPINSRWATAEDAVAVASSIATPETGSTKELLDELSKHGLAIDVWFPRDIEGSQEEVGARRKAEDDYDRSLRRERAEIEDSLRVQMDNVSNDLGVSFQPFINVEKGRVSLSIDEWKRLMNRVEALTHSGPLNTGTL